MVIQQNYDTSFGHEFTCFFFVSILGINITQLKIFYVTQMLNIDKEFKEVSNTDFNVDNQNMTTQVASITTRQIQEIDSPFNDLYMTVDIPDAYRVDAKSFIERPFFVDEVTFPATAARYSLLSANVKFVPGDIARSNPSVLNMFKMAAYGRPDLILNVSMAGTITHAGCVLVGVLPPLPAYPVINYQARLINSILSGPHAFLHANEATSVAIPVPWYCNTDLATTDMELTAGYDNTIDITTTNGNYATIVYMVLNPLRPSTGSTTELKIIVEACFKNFDLAVPTPRYVTWQAQAGMFNPVYEDFERLAKEYNIHQWDALPPEKKSRAISKLARYLPYVGIGTSLAAILLRVGFSCIAGEDFPIPLDYVLDANQKFTAQSGIVNSIIGGTMSLATGLLDSAANGLKTIASDAIDAGRGLVREYTGLHNPNIPEIHQRVINTNTNFVNNTDVPQFFEKLDPFIKFNRIVKEPIFNSSLDEMAISNIVTKKQLIGSFKVNTSDTIGKMLWARPISPFQGGLGTFTPDGGLELANNIELIHTMSRAWRGGLKITIQSVMNNKQQCKLKIIKMYNPSTRITSAYPAYKTVVNAPTHLLEFTQGGQEHEVELPYLCRNDLTPCAANTSTEALFHGIYYVYVAQPLVKSDSSPDEIEFNIFISGMKDLTFYGYTTANTYHGDFDILPIPTALTQSTTPFVSVTSITPSKALYKNIHNENEWYITQFKHFYNIPDSEKNPHGKDPATAQKFARFQEDNKLLYKNALALYKQCADAITEPVLVRLLNKAKVDKTGKVISVDASSLRTWQIIKLKQLLGVEEKSFFAQSGTVKVMNEPQVQSHVTRVDSKEPNLSHMTRLMPSLDIRHFIRRMYKSSVYENTFEPSSTSNVVLPLASVLGEDPSNWFYTPIETFSRMYYGKTAGFKFRLLVTNNQVTPEETVDHIDLLNLRVYYIPQNIVALTNTKTAAAAGVNTSAFASPFVPSESIPLPFQIIGKESTTSHVVYEFSVPDTSLYKFMGGPNKFYDFSSIANVPSLAQADFGSVVIQFTNLSRVKPVRATIETFVGLTDESRFGFHTIAPPLVVYKPSALYTGTDTNPGTPLPAVLNPFVYRGGFIDIS